MALLKQLYREWMFIMGLPDTEPIFFGNIHKVHNKSYKIGSFKMATPENCLIFNVLQFIYPTSTQWWIVLLFMDNMAWAWLRSIGVVPWGLLQEPCYGRVLAIIITTSSYPHIIWKAVQTIEIRVQYIFCRRFCSELYSLLRMNCTKYSNLRLNVAFIVQLSYISF